MLSCRKHRRIFVPIATNMPDATEHMGRSYICRLACRGTFYGKNAHVVRYGPPCTMLLITGCYSFSFVLGPVPSTLRSKYASKKVNRMHVVSLIAWSVLLMTLEAAKIIDGIIPHVSLLCLVSFFNCLPLYGSEPDRIVSIGGMSI